MFQVLNIVMSSSSWWIIFPGLMTITFQKEFKGPVCGDQWHLVVNLQIATPCPTPPFSDFLSLLRPPRSITRDPTFVKIWGLKLLTTQPATTYWESKKLDWSLQRNYFVGYDYSKMHLWENLWSRLKQRWSHHMHYLLINNNNAVGM